MIPLPLAWTLITVSLWTSGSSEILKQEFNILYPEIHSTQAIECDCTDNYCDSVYWFHISSHGKVQFIGRSNSADRDFYGYGTAARFKISKRGSTSYTLRISNVTEQDAGSYSCVLKNRKNTEEMWKSGVLLRPGVTPPTLPPKTKPKPPVNSVCRCPKKNSSQDGCGYLILWPLVGLVAGLALALIYTLYYFSRLPKKCRHHFVRSR